MIVYTHVMKWSAEDMSKTVWYGNLLFMEVL